MPTPTSHSLAPPSDAAIDAAVRRLLVDITGVACPAPDHARRYQHAVDVVAEEVTELIATLVRQR